MSQDLASDSGQSQWSEKANEIFDSVTTARGDLLNELKMLGDAQDVDARGYPREELLDLARNVEMHAERWEEKEANAWQYAHALIQAIEIKHDDKDLERIKQTHQDLEEDLEEQAPIASQRAPAENIEAVNRLKEHIRANPWLIEAFKGEKFASEILVSQPDQFKELTDRLTSLGSEVASIQENANKRATEQLSDPARIAGILQPFREKAKQAAQALIGLRSYMSTSEENWASDRAKLEGEVTQLTKDLEDSRATTLSRDARIKELEEKIALEKATKAPQAFKPEEYMATND